MLTVYPYVKKLEFERQGTVWWFCDAPYCIVEAEVKDATIPKGWVTNDPDNDPLRGAAQFCADHEPTFRGR